VISSRPTRRKVLVVASDEALSLGAARALRAAGHDVELAVSAVEGVERARDVSPDCIVVDLALSDIEGYWVVRHVRGDASRVATAPIVLLAEPDDLPAPARGLKVGADACLVKPVDDEMLVLQVEAMLRFAARLFDRTDSVAPHSAKGPPALRGDLERMSLATVLMVIEMERRSGRLHVESEGAAHTCIFGLEQGTFVVTVMDGQAFDTLAALRQVLAWKRGRFWFMSSEVLRSSNPAGSIGAMLLEAMRLEDEAQR
jgi:DNA-binding response OmpR family regulator